MYNILIIDDEELICRGLKSMIERSSHNDINKVQTISNTEKVQELVAKFQPDIIITDIRMPQMSGLDIIKNISKLNKNIKFIVLSGYDDFNYVKEAFKLGVQDYLLKPVTIDELRDVLNKIINIIKEEQQIKISQENKTHQYMEAILENKLNKLFSGSQLSEENIKDTFKELKIVFQYKFFSVSALNINEGISDSKNLENIRLCLDKVMEKLINKTEIAIFYLYDLNNNLVFIFNHSNEIKIGQLKEYLVMLMSSLKESMNLQCISSISDIGSDIKSIITSHLEAMEALTYRLVYELNEVIEYSEIKDKCSMEDSYLRQLDRLKEYVINYNTINISNLIDELFSKNNLKDINIKSIVRLYNKTITKIYEVAEEENIIIFIDKPFSSFNSLSDLKIHLKTLIFDFISLLKKRGSEKSISDVVKKYVNENYSKDIDMAVVSNMVSLSYTHFSKIFKDESGMNFSDYLTKVRMEKALEMVSNPVNKINDISKSVSYNNPKHFTRAFKNYFGFSPSEYRVNMNKEV